MARTLALEYLEYNELGLAWDSVREGLIDPSPEEVAQMVEVGRWMGLDYDDLSSF
jgi:hypothetical protein